MFKVRVVQFKPVRFEIEKNVNKVMKIIEGVDSNFIVFPELAFTGYAFSSKKEVEETYESPLDGIGYAFKTFKEFSKDTGVSVVYGFNEKYEGKYYNSSILIKSDGTYKIYRKTHLFFREKLFFTPGDTGFWVDNINGINVGVAICFDWYFPESFRTLALLGADLILHPANLVLPYCQEANKIRSLENKIYIATSNIWGTQINGEIEYSFTGKSQVTSPDGEVLFRLPDQGDFIQTVEIDERKSQNKRINEYNDLFQDRKPKYYFHS
ncbi:MAG: hypothetical protein PWQ78_51 [Petrotoga sp.]|nr:hypothetical protein [Petrotoga sp.]